MTPEKTRTEPVNDTVALGRAIRGRRKAAGLTQSDLADAAGTSLRFVSEVERGKPTARLEGVMRLIAELGLGLYIGPR